MFIISTYLDIIVVGPYSTTSIFNMITYISFWSQAHTHPTVTVRVSGTVRGRRQECNGEGSAREVSPLQEANSASPTVVSVSERSVNEVRLL